MTLNSEKVRRSPQSTARDLALIASFAALIAVSAVIPAIPIGGPVAITLQTFSVLLAGALLGPIRGFLAVLLYIAVGLAGLPVFAGGAASLTPFFGPSAGYLVAMPFAAALTGLIVKKIDLKNAPASIAKISGAALLSTAVILYPLGILVLAWRTDMTIIQAFVFNLAFTPGDIIKSILVGVIAAPVLRSFPALRSR